MYCTSFSGRGVTHILYLSYTHTYLCSIHIIYTGICNLTLSYHIMVHLRSFTFFFLFISSHITNLYTYLYLYISNLYLFRSPIGFTELIPIRRYLYTYLYFYLSYTCIYLILCMNNYDYHICLLFFLIYGPNMSFTFIILCMAGFLTQWDFHRVQEHPKRSSDEEAMTFRSWMSHVVTSSRADLNWPSWPDLAELNMTPTSLHRHMNRFLTQWAFHRVQKNPKRSSDEGVMTFRSWRSYVVTPSRADLNWPSSADLGKRTITWSTGVRIEKFKILTSSSLMWLQFFRRSHSQSPFISYPKTSSKVWL